MGWMYVAAQFTLSPAVVIIAYFENKFMNRPSSALFFIFSLIILITAAVVGVLAIVNFNQWVTPVPIPRNNSKLVTRGIYSVIRHPMYLSVILFVTGGVLYFGAYYSLVLTVFLFLFFRGKINFEERILLEHFPEYKSYKNKTKKLIPFVY